MRSFPVSHRARLLPALLAAAASLIVAAALPEARAQSLPASVSVGSGPDTAYFVLDFNDGTATPEYGFTYSWDPGKGVTPTVDTLVDALTTSAPGFSAGFDPPGAFGRFYTSFGYAGKLQGTPGDFSAFWNFDTYVPGTDMNWQEASVGASGYNLINGGYTAFAFGGYPTTPDVTVVSSASSPEPGSLALVFAGAAGPLLAGVARRRNRR